jgi:hypothetical protein
MSFGSQNNIDKVLFNVPSSLIAMNRWHAVTGCLPTPSVSAQKDGYSSTETCLAFHEHEGV